MSVEILAVALPRPPRGVLAAARRRPPSEARAGRACGVVLREDARRAAGVPALVSGEST